MSCKHKTVIIFKTSSMTDLKQEQTLINFVHAVYISAGSTDMLHK